jgi:DNA-binding response OmpR family regulator
MTPEHNSTKILLVSDNSADIGSIKMQLEESINFPCYIWHCRTLDEALGYLNKRKLRADIIILDLDLHGPASPKEVYEKMDVAAHNIPIIVLTGTGKEEHELATFVMEAGASDHMVRGHFSRLSDAIEFSLIRNKIKSAASHQGSRDLEDRQNEHDIETMEAKRKSDKKNHEKNQYISWVMGGYSVEENHKQL